ncbi:MAG: VOC family protein [Candidatus Jordarchaeales archaeon]
MLSLHHVGIVVKDLKSAVSKFCRALGMENDKVTVHHGIYSSSSGEVEEFEYAFIPLGNGVFIELVSPISDGPTMRFLKKKGEGLFHVAFETDDVQSVVERFAEAGIPIAGENPIGETFSVFFHPKHAHGVLIQVIKRGLFLPDGKINPKALQKSKTH